MFFFQIFFNSISVYPPPSGTPKTKVGYRFFFIRVPLVCLPIKWWMHLDATKAVQVHAYGCKQQLQPTSPTLVLMKPHQILRLAVSSTSGLYSASQAARYAECEKWGYLTNPSVGTDLYRKIAFPVTAFTFITTITITPIITATIITTIDHHHHDVMVPL